MNLERRYGKRLMLYSGIHFNFSFSELFLRTLYESKHTTSSYNEFKNNLYFRLLKQTSHYSWLIVLLTAASPVYDLSFDSDDKIIRVTDENAFATGRTLVVLLPDSGERYLSTVMFDKK